MLAAGYLYHVTAGGDSVAFDVGLYVLLMGAGFLLAAVFNRPGRPAADGFAPAAHHRPGRSHAPVYLPAADHVLFTDLSGANTWQVIPY